MYICRRPDLRVRQTSASAIVLFMLLWFSEHMASNHRELLGICHCLQADQLEIHFGEKVK